MPQPRCWFGVEAEPQVEQRARASMAVGFPAGALLVPMQSPGVLPAGSALDLHLSDLNLAPPEKGLEEQDASDLGPPGKGAGTGLLRAGWCPLSRVLHWFQGGGSGPVPLACAGAASCHLGLPPPWPGDHRSGAWPLWPFPGVLTTVLV